MIANIHMFSLSLSHTHIHAYVLPPLSFRFSVTDEWGYHSESWMQLVVEQRDKLRLKLQLLELDCLQGSEVR